MTTAKSSAKNSIEQSKLDHSVVDIRLRSENEVFVTNIYILIAW
ncbi:hypothetical protein QE439_003248 [Pedobacter agri]|nr:hypothetical protein [Pedobacter agri]